jgi:tetratricopeptide (TPR) repeat protein
MIRLTLLILIAAALPLAAQPAGRAQAIALIEQFEKDPANWPKDRLIEAAVAYANLGDFDAALPIFEEIARADPKNGRALRGIATIHLFKKDLPAAEDYFLKAIAAGDTQAAKGLAGIYCAQRQFAKMKPLLPALLELKKEQTDAAVLVAAYALNAEPRDKALFDQAAEGLVPAAVIQSGAANVAIMAEAYKAFGYDDKASDLETAAKLKASP